MTRYEHGFITKCAECGLSADQSMKLMRKVAFTTAGLPFMPIFLAPQMAKNLPRAVRRMVRSSPALRSAGRFVNSTVNNADRFARRAGKEVVDGLRGFVPFS